MIKVCLLNHYLQKPFISCNVIDEIALKKYMKVFNWLAPLWRADSCVWDSCDMRFFYNSLSSVLWENQIPDIRGIWIGSSNIFSLCSGNENKVIYLDWVLKFLVLDDSRELNLSNIDNRIIRVVNCITKLFDILFEKH